MCREGKGREWGSDRGDGWRMGDRKRRNDRGMTRRRMGEIQMHWSDAVTEDRDRT